MRHPLQGTKSGPTSNIPARPPVQMPRVPRNPLMSSPYREVPEPADRRLSRRDEVAACDVDAARVQHALRVKREVRRGRETCAPTYGRGRGVIARPEVSVSTAVRLARLVILSPRRRWGSRRRGSEALLLVFRSDGDAASVDPTGVPRPSIRRRCRVRLSTPRTVRVSEPRRGSASTESVRWSRGVLTEIVLVLSCSRGAAAIRPDGKRALEPRRRDPSALLEPRRRRDPSRRKTLSSSPRRVSSPKESVVPRGEQTRSRHGRREPARADAVEPARARRRRTRHHGASGAAAQARGAARAQERERGGAHRHRGAHRRGPDASNARFVKIAEVRPPGAGALSCAAGAWSAAPQGWRQALAPLVLHLDARPTPASHARCIESQQTRGNAGVPRVLAATVPDLRSINFLRGRPRRK